MTDDTTSASAQAELPPLPAASSYVHLAPMFSADQMREYARAAIAAVPALDTFDRKTEMNDPKPHCRCDLCGNIDYNDAVRACLRCGSAQAEREQFEAHFKHLDHSTTKDAWGHPLHVHPLVGALWNGWKARAAVDKESLTAASAPTGQGAGLTDADLSDLMELHKQSTAGKWQQGLTSHHTVSVKQAVQPVAIMDLVESYCEMRHTLGAPEYNVVTARARNKLLDALAASQPVAEDTRNCTCHPDDRPAECQKKFAASECIAASKPTNRAAERDALLQAAIDFIGTLTGMKPPPIETAPPETFAPFHRFVDEVQRIVAASRPVSSPTVIGIPTSVSSPTTGALTFRIDSNGILHFNDGGCRPASNCELEMWFAAFGPAAQTKADERGSAQPVIWFESEPCTNGWPLSALFPQTGLIAFSSQWHFTSAQPKKRQPVNRLTPLYAHPDSAQARDAARYRFMREVPVCIKWPAYPRMHDLDEDVDAAMSARPQGGET